MMGISALEWTKVKKVVSTVIVNFEDDGDGMDPSEILVLSAVLLKLNENMESTEEVLSAIKLEIENVFHEMEILNAKADFGVK